MRAPREALALVCLVIIITYDKANSPLNVSFSPFNLRMLLAAVTDEANKTRDRGEDQGRYAVRVAY